MTDKRVSTVGDFQYLLPPYNQAGKPPLTIAVLDSCFSGTSNWFLATMYPYWTAYLPGVTVDQALIGWTIATPAKVARDCAIEFWGAMAEGFSAEKARTKMQAKYFLADGTTSDPNKADNVSTLTQYHVTDAIILFGDPATTMTGVYTGNANEDDPDKSIWYRSN